MGKRRNGLTDKQKSFARELATERFTISEAYRRVYSAENMSGAVVRNEASKLAGRSEITVMVEQLIAERRSRDRVVGVSDRDRVLTKLRQLLDDGAPMVEVAAARLLGQSCGLFSTDISITSTTRDPDVIEAELLAKLEALTGLVTEPEPEPEPVTEPEPTPAPADPGLH